MPHSGEPERSELTDAFEEESSTDLGLQRASAGSVGQIPPSQSTADPHPPTQPDLDSDGQPGIGDEVVEVVDATPRTILRARLGHDRDAAAHIETFLVAQAEFELGRNKRALHLLGPLKQAGLSPELAAEVEALVRRIRPDPFALSMALLCVLLLIVVWFAATA